MHIDCEQDEIVLDLCPTPFLNLRDYLKLGKNSQTFTLATFPFMHRIMISRTQEQFKV